MTNPNETRPDHGEFQTQVSDESPLIAEAIRKASGNVDGAPGRYWIRAVVKFEADGQKREILHMWGVDLIDRTLVTIETESDVELARRQRPLSEAEIKAAFENRDT